jgi:hypothetical protein
MSKGVLRLPTASVLLIAAGSGDFGTSPFFGQLTDKTRLAHALICGVPDAENNRRREIAFIAILMPAEQGHVHNLIIHCAGCGSYNSTDE